MKRIMLISFIMAILIVLFNVTISLAANVSYEEAQELINKVPNEINLNIKESEFLNADDLLNAKLKEIIAREDIYAYINLNIYGFEDELDINKANVTIYTDETDDEDKYYVEKVINVSYSNSENWNEEDNKYVENIAKNTNFHRRWDYIINSDGTEGEYQDKSDFSWNKVMKVDDIKAIEILSGGGGDYFSSGENYDIFLFKNDVLYKIVKGSRQDTGKIIIPETTEETDESYINYAKPIIDKIVCSTDEWEDEGINYKNITTVKDIYRSYEDFIQFTVITEFKEYKNDVLDYEDEFKTTVLIAKENEFRGKLLPVLQNVEIIEKNNLSYLKGKMKITETLIGYNTSIDEEYLPKIVLIDENNKSYETAVTRSEDDIYYFEIKLDNIEINKQYKIQAISTTPNNKYPENNIDATLAEGVNINLSNEDITVKSVNSESIAKLSISKNNENTLGDINMDGKINARDARLALQFFAGKVTLSDEQKIVADVNKDGKINARDARLILQLFAGKIKEF